MVDFFRDIASLPYARRRLLTIAEKWIALVDEANEQGLSGRLLTEGYIAEQLAERGGGTWTAWRAVPQLNSIGRQAGKMQALGVLPVTLEESRPLQFPPNHPQAGVVYAAHPLRSLLYFPLAEFHTRIFEDKFSEILRILSALGARRIAVTASEGWGREIAEELSADFQGITALAGERKAGLGQQSLLYLANLPGNVSRSLPDGLIWYGTEPTWQELARQRLEHSLREFRLLFQYRNDYGITQGLAVAMLTEGLRAGGTFRQHVNTTWILAGEFSSP